MLLVFCWLGCAATVNASKLGSKTLLSLVNCLFHTCDSFSCHWLDQSVMNSCNARLHTCVCSSVIESVVWFHIGRMNLEKHHEEKTRKSYQTCVRKTLDLKGHRHYISYKQKLL